MNAQKAAFCDPEEKMPLLMARHKWKENNVNNKKTARQTCSKFN